MYCFPCRLFNEEISISCTVQSQISLLTSSSGYSINRGWKKLYDRIPAHENSQQHKECYLKWRQQEEQLRCGTSIFDSINQQIQSNVQQWKEILKRILVVMLFLCERGLAFREDSQKIDDPHNGNLHQNS